MQKCYIIFLLLTGLCACAPQSSNYAKLSDAHNAHMATDAAHQLLIWYPPASTHFALSQAADDAFGMALQKDLRESGYAVHTGSGSGNWIARTFSEPAVTSKAEFHSDRIQKPAVVDPDATHQAAPVIAVNAPDISAKTIPLSYIVDAIGDNLYRITVKSGAQVMSRVYGISGGRLSAMGVWTRRTSAQEE